LLLWNYADSKPVFTLPCHRPDEGSFCHMDAVLDAPRNALYVFWSDWSETTRVHTCVLEKVDLRTQAVSTVFSGCEQTQSDSQAMSLRPNGRYLTLRWNETIYIMDAEAPSKILETMTVPQNFQISDLQFSPDSKFLAVSDDGVTTVLALNR